VLALGGASWPKLGSDGGWADIVARKGVVLSPLMPSNCGFTIPWSDMIRRRFAGQPLKHIALSFGGRTVRGDCVITEYGIEGGAVYALSGLLRDAIAASGPAKLVIDLRPDMPMAELARKLERPKSGQSLANFLRKTVNLSKLETNLLRETYGIELPTDAATLAKRIKSLPLTLTAPQTIARAISTAGGVAFSALDDNLMLRALSGVFAAGEMLDWEAPTGGYLLQACFASGAAAARGARRYLDVIPAA